MFASTAAASSIRTQHGDRAEIPLVVANRWLIAEDVMLLRLREQHGAALPEWSPGAHIDLCLAPGLVRQYSLTGAPEGGTCWEVAVQLVRDGSGSRFVHENLVPGAAVIARGPRNNFPLVASQRYLFVAGGIGITPMLPMVASAQAAGARWELHYGGRKRRRMAFLEHLEGYGDKVRVCPEDATGLLDLSTILAAPRSDTAVFCCGPRGLLDAVEQRCASWPAGRLHVENFAPRPPLEPASANRAFDVVLAQSGRTLHVPADQSILEVVEEAGMTPPASCTEGVCGTCETGVLDGRPQHRDSVLTEQERAEGDTMMICVSRSHTARLTLDM